MKLNKTQVINLVIKDDIFKTLLDLNPIDTLDFNTIILQFSGFYFAPWDSRETPNLSIAPSLALMEPISPDNSPPSSIWILP